MQKTGAPQTTLNKTPADRSPPNHFTQITWFAFLRRIAKEKKQQDVKLKYLAKAGIENFIDNDLGDEMSQQVVGAFVDTLRDRIDKVKNADTEVKEFAKMEKKRRKRSVDSDLQEFMN